LIIIFDLCPLLLYERLARIVTQGTTQGVLIQGDVVSP